MNSDLLPATPGTGEEGFDELAAGTPAQYLEKIFQVVMTLPPLHAAGYTTLLDTLVGVRADETPVATDTITMTEHAEVTVLDPGRLARDGRGRGHHRSRCGWCPARGRATGLRRATPAH